jgi:hypothetical protein
MTRVYRKEMFAALEFLHWVDDDGNRLEHVEDRFGTRYAIYDHDYHTTHFETLANTGVGVLTLNDAVAMGFTSEEYLKMMQFIFDHSGKECVVSEDELNGLFSRKPAETVAAPTKW